MENWIKFLGTAGARFVMLKQLRSSAGVWYHLENLNILLDPGPGTLVKCASSRPALDVSKLDGILLSHKHLDHSTDINVMIEGMTDGGFKRRGFLLAPSDALEDDPVILKYLRQFPERIEILSEGAEYRLAESLSISTVKHMHPVETYGIKFHLPQLTIGHLVDTAYFDGLIEAYAGMDVLIMHVVRLRGENDQEKGIQHLNLEDARKLIAEIKPRIAVLTHFGMTMLKAKPWELAEQLSKEIGVPVKAASDGWTLRLSEI